jgi:hypothetical protein
MEAMTARIGLVAAELAKHGPITARGLAERMGLTHRLHGIQHDLFKLCDKGYLTAQSILWPPITRLIRMRLRTASGMPLPLECSAWKQH